MAHSCTMSQTFLYKVFLSPAWLTQVSRPDFFYEMQTLIMPFQTEIRYQVAGLIF